MLFFCYTSLVFFGGLDSIRVYPLDVVLLFSVLLILGNALMTADFPSFAQYARQIARNFAQLADLSSVQQACDTMLRCYDGGG